MAEALKKLRIKNFLLFEQGHDEKNEDFMQFKGHAIKEKSFGDNGSKFPNSWAESYNLYQILRTMKEVENICIFDASRNDVFAKILHVSPNFEKKKFFLNFDQTNPLPFEVSPFVFIKSKKSLDEKNLSNLDAQIAQAGIVPQLQIESFPQRQKIASEPFKPQPILEIQQLNSADRKYWKHPESPSDDVFKKPNQSFDEIILNASSDQVLQKRNAPFMKSQIQHPFATAQGGLNPRRPTILYDQPLKNIEINGSLKLSHFFQQELRKIAETGDLLIMREDLIKALTVGLQTKFNAKIDDILKKAEDLKLIHTTIRKFLDIQPLFYVGILLDVLSVESLKWIVKSIKNDMMSPTEKLIISRIKECYGLKIDSAFWKNMITYILANQVPKQTKSNSFEHASIFPLYAKKILDPVTNTDTYVLYLTNDDWIPEDQGTIDENSEEWKGFMVFITNFFREEENSIDQKNNSFSKNPHQDLDLLDQGKKTMWSSSVENVLNRSTNKKDKSLKISEDIKAIPGGRYGCAQFIKICGPEVLKKLSIGRLTLFVQEAINKGILRYQRTLLVKNNPNDSIASTLTEVDTSFSQDPALERKTKLLKTIKDFLIEILSENPDGIPLAQIPLHLKRKMDYVVNFQDLGFPKLKNFLATLPDLVKIESSGTNHAFVKLKNPMPLSGRKNLSLKDQIFLPEGQDSTRNSSGPQSTNAIFQYNMNSNNANVTYDQANFDPARYKTIGDKKYSTTPSSDAKNSKNGRKKVSTLDDYLNKVKGLIELILTDNCYGISLQKLYKELSNKLSFDFDWRLFNCNDFYDFLITYAENLLDIEIKRNCLIIYPKNFRFGPQTLVNVINTEQQRTNMKTPPEYYDPNNSKQQLNFVNPHLNPNASPFVQDLSHRSTGELDTPPGLATKPMFKPSPSPFGMPFNNPGFMVNMPQTKPNNPNKTNDTVGTPGPNLSNISPIVFYGNEDDDAISDKQFFSSQHSRNVSYWKIDFLGNNINTEEGRLAMSSISQINTGMHSRADSRSVKAHVQEESNLEIRENLRFIEELLQDNDYNEKSIMTNFTLDKTLESSFGGIQSPNLSFTGLTAIGQATNSTMKQCHSKTQSEDFTNKNNMKYPNGHGRVSSVVPDRKND
jgi:hypothetical protein